MVAIPGAEGKPARPPGGPVTRRWLPGPPSPRHRAGRRAPATTAGRGAAGGPPGGGPPAGGCGESAAPGMGSAAEDAGLWEGEGSSASRCGHPGPGLL